MQDRRPRKLKKTLKRKFEKFQAFRTVQIAVTTMGSAYQMSVIASQPIDCAPYKTMATAQLAMTTAQSISKIMNTGPKNWREA